MRAREINHRIERLGGISVRQVGSHRRYAVAYADETTREDRTAFTTVPQHSGYIPTGTVRAIERDLERAFGKGWLR